MDGIIVILFLISIICFAVAYFLNGMKNEDIIKEYDKEINRGMYRVKTSNLHLDDYVRFIEDHKDEYGEPDKTVGASRFKRIVVLERGERQEKGKIDENGFPIMYLLKGYATREELEHRGVVPAVNDMIMVYAKSKKIVLKSGFYNFDQILSYQVRDNASQITSGGTATSKTTTDSGSLIGRSMVGGALGGEMGALIGAGSASKTTTTDFSDTETVTRHQYVLYISVKDFETPLIQYNFEDKEQDLQESIAVLDIILSDNQKVSKE